MSRKICFAAVLVIMSLCAVFSVYSQTSPASPSDMDQEVRRLSVLIGQRLQNERSSGGPAKIAVGAFLFQGYETSLGSYWRESLVTELANSQSRNFSVTLNTGNTDDSFFLQGEITEIGSIIRISTRLIRRGDSSILAGWNSDFTKTPFLFDLLDVGSSSSGNYPRDMYEPDSMENPLDLSPGDDWIPRTIHNGNDQDYFRITLPSAAMLVMETSGNMDTYMYLYDGTNGDQLASNDDGGDDTNAKIEYLAEPGIPYIAMVKGYSDNTGNYRFRARIREIPADVTEPNDTRDRAYLVSLGSTPVQAMFHSSNDADWYKVEIPAGGGRLIVYTEGDMDTKMELHDQRGNLINEDDDSGSDLNARIAASVNPGTYYIKITEYDGSTGLYSFHALLGEALNQDQYEPDDSPAQAKNIEIGVPQRRSFTDGDDVDWARFTVTQRGFYEIRARGETSSALDTYIELYDSSEDLIDEDDDGGDYYDACLEVRLDAGSYLIRVHTLDSDPDDYYILSVEAAGGR
ncbi:PPC domain-containing protein [Treponema sp. OttesenSCG-928-L16]|nr:PPC domain-containing protein [Treponema sp. OttesenSCG-928-L16]